MNTPLIQYFDDIGIQYWVSGKNVKKSNINITCPYCGDHQYSGNNHLGIDPIRGIFSCWICSESGNIVKLIKEISDISWKKAKKIAKELTKDEVFFSPESKSKILPGKILPKYAKQLNTLHIKYLKKRKFNPYHLINKYNLLGTGPVGKYKYRIIIPIYIDHKLVAFTSRDVTDKQKIKALHSDIDKSIIAPNRLLFNIDSINNDFVIIVEGPFDVFRIGDGSICTFGASYTKDQILMLTKKQIKTAIVMFDFMTDEISEKLANQLSAFIDDVKYVSFLNNTDPAELSKKEIIEIKKEVLLNI